VNIVQPLQWPDIKKRLDAQSPEGTPWWLYNTQTFTSNSSTQLTFFTATDTNEDLTNIASGGVLPADNVLFLHGIYIDYFIAAGTAWVTTSAGVVTGAVNDVGMLHLSGRGRLILKIRSKDYGPWPISAFQGLGGVNMFLSGTYAATTNLAAAHNAQGVGVGRGDIGGAIAIPPQTSFKVQLIWPAALTTTGDMRVRVTLHGALYRNVQ